MSPKLKHQLTSASRTADWPGQGDLVKVKHNAKKGWGFALFFIGREKKHVVELPFLTYSCISLLVFYYVLLYLVQQAL